MRKHVIWMILVMLAVGALGTYITVNRSAFAKSPFSESMPLAHLSKMVGDNAQNLYIIGESQQKLWKLNRAGQLLQEIGQQTRKDNHRLLFSNVAVDDHQRIYLLTTELDRYGLYVVSEQIVRYTAEGKLDKLLFQQNYTENANMLRVGKIKSLQVKGNELSFFVAENSKLVLHTIDLVKDQASSPKVVNLPPDTYLSEVAGTQSSPIYYSTKRGEIFRANENGSAQLIYPLAETGRTQRNFPLYLSLDAKNRIYFTDQYTNEIMRLDPAQPSKIETLIKPDALAAYAADGETPEVVSLLVNADNTLGILFSDSLLAHDKETNAIRLYDQASYLFAVKALRWADWLAALAAVALVVLLLRMIYVHIMKRRFSLILKQILSFMPVLIISMLLLSNFIYQSYTDRMEQEMMRELALLARNGKNVIDGDKLQKFQSAKDFMNDDFKAIKKKMNFLFEGQDSLDRRGLYSTLYKYEGGRFYLIADDDDGVNMYKPYPTTDENLRVVEKGEISTGFWEDGTGAWMYAIAPLYNSAGQIVGVYETGRDMSVLVQSNQKIYSSVLKIIWLIAGGVVVLFGITTYFQLSSIRKLRNSVNDMANGNWFSEVKIGSRDEVADLGERFNYMASHIRRYITNLTHFSEASSRFVPQQFLQHLGKDDLLEIELGDQVQSEMVVMVANIRSFYHLSKRLTPKEIFNFMNSFLRRFGPIVRNSDGLISKYLGAGFMALFPNSPKNALESAIEIRKELHAYNQHRIKVGYAPVDIGIGIHKGQMMLGIIGEEKRMEGSVISDDVNIATMLEKITEELGVSILITEQALQSIENYRDFQHRNLGRIFMEGPGQELVLYDVYEGDEQSARLGKEKTKDLFEQGVVLYQQGRFFDAREIFVDVIKQNRFDKAAKLYFYLCDEYYQRGTAKEWNGTLSVS